MKRKEQERNERAQEEQRVRLREMNLRFLQEEYKRNVEVYKKRARRQRSQAGRGSDAEGVPPAPPKPVRKRSRADGKRAKRRRREKGGRGDSCKESAAENATLRLS